MPRDADDDFEEFDDAPRRPRRRRRDDDDDEGDATGGVIPYKNGTALAAYYCGVFSFIPGLGCVLGPVAIVLGVLGVLHASKYPRARGKGHAVAGIVLGLVGPFFVAGVFALLVPMLGR